MAKHYSTKDFFRNTPNAMLARYFAAREVLEDFDFAAIKETKIEPLFEAWLVVSEAQRAKMEVDLREIGDMSNEKGVTAIIEPPPDVKKARTLDIARNSGLLWTASN